MVSGECPNYGKIFEKPMKASENELKLRSAALNLRDAEFKNGTTDPKGSEAHHTLDVVLGGLREIQLWTYP